MCTIVFTFWIEHWGPPPVGRSNGKEQSGRSSLCFRKGYRGGHSPPMPKMPTGTKWVWPLHQRMRRPCEMFAIKSWKLLQVCRMIWTDLTMKWEEDHGPIAKVEPSTECNPGVSIEDGPEAKVEHDLWDNTELKLEVHTGNVLGVDLGTEQEPGLGITIKLTPKMNRPILETVARNPNIGGSVLGCLKARTQQQRAGNLLLNCPLRT